MRGWRTRITSATTPRPSRRKCSRKSQASSTSTSINRRRQRGAVFRCPSSIEKRLDGGELFALGALGLLRFRGHEQGDRDKTRGVGDGRIARDHGCYDRAIHQQAELMRQHMRLGCAHLAGELLYIAENDLLVPHRNRAELFLILVVFADRVDEGAAVEAFLTEPVFQRRENPREFRLRAAAAGLDGADEPFTPLLAFGLKHDV